MVSERCLGPVQDVKTQNGGLKPVYDAVRDSETRLCEAKTNGTTTVTGGKLGDLLARTIHSGLLTLRIGSAPGFTIGTPVPGRPDLAVSVAIRDNATALAIALDPDLQLGEAYMEGRLVIEQGSLWTFLEIIGRNIVHRPPNAGFVRLRRKLGGWLAERNNPDRAQRNVAHHYDLSEDLYRLFLDEDMQYSCAYFSHPAASLDEAQTQKKAHIAAKLALQPGQKVLDIGCGWGGMALFLARVANVDVTGITLSVEQLRVARARAEEAGLSDRVRFELIDYREMEGCFDRIVSVGMFEHVGLGHYDEYFAAISRLLAPDGVALVHTIGRKDPGPGCNPWMVKHIFPGGFVPTMSQALAAIEHDGLWVTDIEVLRLHYAQTLRHWRERVEAARSTIIARMGPRFYRMWEFYLAGCEMSFRYDGLMVFQVQLTKDIEALPITRDYLFVAEA